MKAEEYRQQLREQEHRARWGQFRQLYPEPVWAQMSEVQQAQAWASWQQSQHVARASRTNLTPLWVVLGVVGALIVLYVVSQVLFY